MNEQHESDRTPPRGGAAQVQRTCPNCSAPLEEHKCKLVCRQCGFFLSCSDFY